MYMTFLVEVCAVYISYHILYTKAKNDHSVTRPVLTNFSRQNDRF